MIRINPSSPPPQWIIEEANLAPDVEARLRAAFAQHALNVKWYEAHANTIHTDHAGKYVVVVDGEVFAGSTPREADEAARGAHPDSGGAFRLYVRPRTAG